MKYGVYLPNFGDEVTPMALAELARDAEKAGWDGFFIWDHLLYNKSQKLKVVDPWIVLTAVAMVTKRIHFGTTLTPLARRRPWQFARESTTLDNLSGGRLILSVGLGDPPDADFAFFGEDPDPKVRAEKLDEGLDILDGLWSGKKFHYQGKHYNIQGVTFLPTPLQKPRIPIWVGGFWPNKGPFIRAAQWDGVLPLKKYGGVFVGPEDLAEIMAFIKQHRKIELGTSYDAVVIGTRPGLGKKASATKKTLADLENSGATWWLQSLYMERNSVEQMRAAIRQGRPE